MVNSKKKSRRRLGSRAYQNYTNEMMNIAIEYVSNKKMSSREAERHFGIPRRTILYKIKKKHVKSVGSPTRLTKEEEERIVSVMIKAADYGCPLTKLELRIIVHEYLKKNGREDIFSGNLPGKRWLEGFLGRHADQLTVRSCQNIKSSRAQKGVSEFLEYFQNLEKTLKDIPPSHILNLDETNLSDDPGSSKCIFRRGVKYPERVVNSTKGAISLMFSATADGILLPTYVVYKAENLYSEWLTGGPRDTRYNRTRSGWFDSATFEDYFKTIILKWADSLEGKKVVICDNLSSHLNITIIELCEQHNISFVFIPPFSTHLAQPLDVAFFAPLKKEWRKILLDYKLRNPTQSCINKNHFPKLLSSLIEAIKLKEASNIKSGFRAAGIVPLNPRALLRRLPEYEEDLGSYTVDTALLDYLKKMRQSKPILTKRNKKVAVEAGKSISVEDFQISSISTDSQETQKTKLRKCNKNNGIGAKKSKKIKIISEKDREEDDFVDSSMQNINYTDFNADDIELNANDIDLNPAYISNIDFNNEIFGINDIDDNDIHFEDKMFESNVENDYILDEETGIIRPQEDTSLHQSISQNDSDRTFQKELILKTYENKSSIGMISQKPEKKKPIILSNILLRPANKNEKVLATEKNKRGKENIDRNVKELFKKAGNRNLNNKTVKNTKKKQIIKKRRMKLNKKTLSEETSNSDVSVSIHSDSDICDINSDKNSTTSDNYTENSLVCHKEGKNKSVLNNENDNSFSSFKEASCAKASTSFDNNSNVNIENYSIGDTVLVRYFFKNRVEYFVGTVIEKIGHDKLKVSFFKKVGKNDNVKFIKTNTQEIAIIDCKNIVKVVHLLTINNEETDFVFYDDDDYVYFDY